jgi:cell division protein ZapA (FtsZ GTPase activity inhibitor)
MDELKRQTRQLDTDVQQLTGEVHRLNDRADRTDRDKKWVIVGLLLIVGLVALVAFVAVRAQQTSDAAQRTADQQDELRAQVLCPLYSIFLGAYDPKTRDKNPDPQARQKYEDAYVKIRHGWEVMGCTDPLVPPRSN